MIGVDLALVAVQCCQTLEGARVIIVEVRTYSTTVRSASDNVILEFKIRIEDRCVELCFAVETIADSLPVSSRF